MQVENKERWMNLCELAAVEQDPKRLSKLVNDICELLEAQQHPPNQTPRQAHNFEIPKL
jgi:hypothetical protein